MNHQLRESGPDDHLLHRGKGGWIWNVTGVELIPYNLPNVTRASADYICEGEKDCESLGRIGMVASCNSMGAGKWKEEYNRYFKNKNVIILPDNDDVGRDHAEKVAASLFGIAKQIKIIELPDLLEKGDVTDWINNGGTKNDLFKLIRHTKNWEPSMRKIHPIVAELNKKYAVVMVGGKSRVMKEIIEPELNRPDLILSPFADFKNFLSNRKVPHPERNSDNRRSKEISIAELWLDSRDRRQYEGLGFSPYKYTTGHSPDKDKNGKYNLFRGFAVEPKKGDWSLFRKHIIKVIANGNIKDANWLIC